MKLIFDNLPEGPAYYPVDQVTDSPEHFIVGELIREKVLFLTREEIPHSVAVVVEEMTRKEQGRRCISGRPSLRNALPRRGS